MKTLLALAFLILTVSASSAAKEIDFDEAVAACEKGNGSMCFMIGAMYKDGLGPEKDIEKAKVYFTKGCELGDAFSCGTLKNLN